MNNTEVSLKPKAVKADLRIVLKELVKKSVEDGNAEWNTVGGMLAEIMGVDIANDKQLADFMRIFKKEWHQQTNAKRRQLIKERLKTQAEKDKANKLIANKEHVAELNKIAAADELPPFVEDMITDIRLLKGGQKEVISRFAEKYQIPTISTKKDLNAIQKQLERVAEMPQGALRDESVRQLFILYAKMNPISAVKRGVFLSDAMFHTNNLSGIATMLANIKWSAYEFMFNMISMPVRIAAAALEGKEALKATWESEKARLEAVAKTFFSRDLYSAAWSPFSITALRTVSEARSVNDYVRRNIAEMDKETRIGGEGILSAANNFLARLYIGKWGNTGINAAGIVASILNSGDLYFQILHRSGQRAALIERSGQNTQSGISFVNKDTPNIQFEYKGKIRTIGDIQAEEVAKGWYQENTSMYYQRQRELHAQAVQDLYGVEELAKEYGRGKLFKDTPAGVYGTIYKGLQNLNVSQKFDDKYLPKIEAAYKRGNIAKKALIRATVFMARSALMPSRLVAYSRVGLNIMQRMMEYSFLMGGINRAYTNLRVGAGRGANAFQRQREYLEEGGKANETQKKRKQSTLNYVNIGARIADVQDSRGYIADEIKKANDAYAAKDSEYTEQENKAIAKANGDATALANIARSFTAMRTTNLNLRDAAIKRYDNTLKLLNKEEVVLKAAYDQAINEMNGRAIGNMLRFVAVAGYILAKGDDDDEEKLINLTGDKWDAKQLRSQNQLRFNLGMKGSLSFLSTPAAGDLSVLARMADIMRQERNTPDKDKTSTPHKALAALPAYVNIMWQVAAMQGMESALDAISGKDEGNTNVPLEEQGMMQWDKYIRAIGMTQAFKVPALFRGLSKDLIFGGENVEIDKKEAGAMTIPLQFARGMGLMDIGLGRFIGAENTVAPQISDLDGKPLYSFQGGEKHAPLRHISDRFVEETDRDPYALTANEFGINDYDAQRLLKTYEWIDKNGIQDVVPKITGAQYKVPQLNDKGEVVGQKPLPLVALAPIRMKVGQASFKKVIQAKEANKFQIVTDEGKVVASGDPQTLGKAVQAGVLDTKDSKYSVIYKGDLEGASRFGVQEAIKDIYSQENSKMQEAWGRWMSVQYSNKPLPKPQQMKLDLQNSNILK